MHNDFMNILKDVPAARDFFKANAIGTHSYVNSFGYNFVHVYFSDGTVADLTSEQWVRIRGW